MYETKTVLRTWYELGWYEGWEVYGYTEFDRSGTPRMAEIRRPTLLAPDKGQAVEISSTGQAICPLRVKLAVRWLRYE